MPRKRITTAKLLIREKLTISGLVREIVIWEVPASAHYPEGIKYRLVLSEPGTGWILVLFDNHSPKGHHLHLREVEKPYQFSSLNRLISDFFALARKAEVSRENKKNSH